jgi:hypothetical protein
MKSFEEIEDQENKAPEALKQMLVSEIQDIRDVMILVNMFMGEPMKAGLKYIQGFEPNNKEQI